MGSEDFYGYSHSFSQNYLRNKKKWYEHLEETTIPRRPGPSCSAYMQGRLSKLEDGLYVRVCDSMESCGKVNSPADFHRNFLKFRPKQNSILVQ
jgi:hypothetical protein